MPGPEPTAATREQRQIFAAVTGCFLVSGATGLLYQVLWTRALSLIFGHTVFAVTTVLAAFMAGLGLGSFLGGRVADRRRDRLAIYGWLELGIGLSCLATPLLFAWAEQIYLALSRALGLAPAGLTAMQFLLAFAILLVPTTLMGATLPAVSRLMVREAGRAGRRVGTLYALNTLGAALGAFGGGFLLLPALGIQATLRLAAVANVGIGLLGLAFQRRLDRLGIPDAPGSGGEPRPAAVAAPHARLVVAAFAISGAASMIYEVAWTRALSLILGSSTYAFSTMLVAFLLGLAGGSAAFARWLGGRAAAPSHFAWLQFGIGAGALLMVPAFEAMPELFVGAFRISAGPAFLHAVQFAISLALLLIPTLLIGATFPCAVGVVAGSLAGLGRDVGRAYAANTAGAIGGTLAAGFLLIPGLGLQGTLKAAMLVNFGAAALLLALAGTGPGARAGAARALLPALAAAGTLALPAWSQAVMTSGPAIYSRMFAEIPVGAPVRGWAARHPVLFYEDGISATVSVHRAGPIVFLRVNGKTDASTDRDMQTQLLLAHLPLLLHDDPGEVLVIGLGSGVTAGAAVQHPVRRVDVVEIEPAVIRAAAFFGVENRGVLADPRVRLHVADARNFLLASPRQYDVIISEPSNPWIEGMGNLFSVEFYRLARQRLRPEGIMVQWVQGYGLRPDDFRMVANTFRVAFPRAGLWSPAPRDFLLLAREGGLPISLERLRARVASRPAVAADLRRIGRERPDALLADLLLDEAALARLADGAGLNTDDLPRLEYAASRSLHLETSAANLRLVEHYRRRDPAAELAASLPGQEAARLYEAVGRVLLLKQEWAGAAARFDRALDLQPDLVPARVGRAQARARLGLVLQAVEDLQAALRREPEDAAAHAALARIYQQQRLLADAERHFRRAADGPASGPEAWAALGQFHLETSQYPAAAAAYGEAVRRAPGEVRLLAPLGQALIGAGRSQEAVALLRAALGRLPDEDGRHHFLLGAALRLSGQLDASERATRVALERNPLSPEAHVELARLHVARGETARARAAFQRAAQLGPLPPAVLREYEALEG
jgi:spermidine synthase